MQDFRGKALLFSQQPQKQVFRANVPVRKPLRLFRGIGQNAFAFIAQRQVDRGRNLLPDGGMSFDLLADGFDRGVRAQETIGQGFVFAQQAEKQMLSLDIRRPELAGFVACEKDDAPGFLRVAFKHNALPPDLPGREEAILPGLPNVAPTPDYYIMQSKGRETQVPKRFTNPMITLPKEPLWISFGPRFHPVSCTLSHESCCYRSGG